MRTEPRAPAGSSRTVDPRRPHRGTLLDHVKPLFAVCLVAAAVAAFFLGLYVVKRYVMPIGWDTPLYLGQANLVAERGLRGIPQILPPPVKTLSSRAGFPTVALPLSSLFSASTFKLAAVVPVSAAVALALAAGAFASSSLKRGAWTMAAVAAVVGISPVVIRLMAPETYTDNLLAAALFTASLVPLTSFFSGGRGLALAVLLLAAGGLASAPFFALISAVLVGVALMCAPRSWRAWRSRSTPLLSTASARLLSTVASASALVAVGLLGFFGGAPGLSRISRSELSRKLAEDLSLYRLPVLLPLAALGALSLAGWTVQRRRSSRNPYRTGLAGEEPPDGTRGRFVLSLCLSWVVVAAAGVLAFFMGINSPAHRFLSFLIPVPILAALGLLYAGKLASMRIARAAGAGVVIAGITVLGYLGYQSFYVDLPRERGVEWLDPGKVQDAATAAAYLEAAGISNASPVVFLVDDTGPNPLSYVPEMAYIIRSVLPAKRVPAAHFYLGDPENYLAGDPTYRERPRNYRSIADSLWPAIRRVLPERPVALVLSSFNPGYRRLAREHPARVVAPNVVALRGSRPERPVTVPPIPSAPRGVLQNAALGTGVLLVLSLMGLGWSFALLPVGTRSFEVLALSPAAGIASLIFGGILMDTAGFRLGGTAGAVTVGILAATGLAAGAMRIRKSSMTAFPAD